MKPLYHCLTLIIFFSFTTIKVEAQSNIYSTKAIQSLIDNDSLVKAEKELKTQTEYYITTKQFDSLSNLVYFHGRIAKLKGETNFIEKSEAALTQLKKLTQNPDELYNAYSDLALLSIDNNLFQESYNYNLKGLEVAKKTTKDRLNKMSKRAYGLSSTSYYMRNLDLVKKHGLEAFRINQKNKEATATNIYSACNILGLMMQNENKLDSALFYYNKGVKALKNSAGNNLNERYYYPAVLNGNMAIIYMNQGDFNTSLKKQQEAIHNYRIIIDSLEKDTRLNSIKYNYLSVINDMGSNYVKLGQVERALQLFEHNYKKAKSYFPENSIQQIIFINQYAQGKWVANDNEDALKLIDEAHNKFKNLSNDYAGYMTFSMATKANILENLNQIEDAYTTYNYCDELYEVINPGNYSHDRLTTLREAAKFYSRNGYVEDANSSANKVLDAVLETASVNDLETIKAYNLLSEIQFNLKNYNSSINWSNKALTIINNNNALKSSDSLFWKGLKTNPLLFKSKSEYEIIDTNDVGAVSEIYKSLRQSIQILNSESSQFESNIDKGDYLFKAKPLIDFAMKVCLNLYKITQNEDYLDHLISMHESSIYNRIRSKLTIREDIQFKNVPKEILEREKLLKDSLAVMRNEQDITENSIKNFIETNNQWHTFLDNLKENYPKYYTMRYQVIKQSVGKIQNNIPENSTVVRYFFIEDALYAFVVNKNTTSLISLKNYNSNLIEESISDNAFELGKTTKISHDLYKQLWMPLETKIKTDHVIIIPDEELFNLSFEMLTQKEVNISENLSQYSLLSKYCISYNYSLYLFDKDKKTMNFNNDFIAFAPEFNSEMKADYELSIKDSLGTDNTYLKLLPQPFTRDLVKQSSKRFDGAFYLNENASKQVFTSQAKEHKIIHIGTHAESNNIAPELSRLIFAKNVNDSLSSEDNSLYTYEIYNQNLSSNLAILTACETGKPTYQAGEGMISLAHAFNYAGSESILTSLWKIDEQSSSKIIKLFYDNISEGLSKDKALQKAKLDYIATAQGRTMAPQYWAGLVLIGDTTPIQLKTSSNFILYIVIGAIIILILLAFISKIRRKDKN